VKKMLDSIFFTPVPVPQSVPGTCDRIGENAFAYFSSRCRSYERHGSERVKKMPDSIFFTPVPVPQSVPGTCDPAVSEVPDEVKRTIEKRNNRFEE